MCPFANAKCDPGRCRLYDHDKDQWMKALRMRCVGIPFNEEDIQWHKDQKADLARS